MEPNKKVLIMGDSITDDILYKKDWSKWFAEETGIEVTNVAVGGSIYDLYRENVDTLNLDDYDYFFLMGGTNNIHAGIPLSKSISDLECVQCGETYFTVMMFLVGSAYFTSTTAFLSCIEAEASATLKLALASFHILRR